MAWLLATPAIKGFHVAAVAAAAPLALFSQDECTEFFCCSCIHLVTVSFKFKGHLSLAKLFVSLCFAKLRVILQGSELVWFEFWSSQIIGPMYTIYAHLDVYIYTIYINMYICIAINNINLYVL